MVKKVLFLSFLFLGSLASFCQNSQRYNYIQKYKDLAISEMERAGVPASIKLAQGILESADGTSRLARKANNHFGMKCGSAWTGKTYYLEDDDYDDNGNLIKSCFRVFKNAKASYIAHSEFLRDPKKRYRYGFLFSLDPRDYKAWSRGLKRAGYATSPTYAEKLIRLIETYELYRFDNQTPDSGPIFEEPEDFEDSGIALLNNTKMISTNEGDTPLEISNRTGVSVKCLLKYNERLTSPTQAIPENARVFLQKKRNGYRGKKKWHQVKEGQTLYHLSQLYGISQKRLRKRNRIDKEREPKVGQLVKLRGWKVSKSKAPKTMKAQDIEETDFIEDVKIDPDNKDTSAPKDETDTSPKDDEVEFLDEEIDLEETFDPYDEILPVEEPLFHRVEKGETLYGIARYYGVPISQIRELNKMENNTLSIGQTLRVK